MIELVGPPGSGKTTVSKALSRQDGILNGGFPDIRDVNNLSFFIGNGFVLLPTFCSLYQKKYGKRPTRQELAYMTILTGWPRILERRFVTQGNTLILDQGPVYMLADLFQYNPKIFTNRAARVWWHKICRRWADTLDLVICLDAPDKSLIERIRRREKQHGIKTNSDQRAIQYLTDHRSAQEKVISDLMPCGADHRVFSFDTTQMSIDETVTHILDVLKKIKQKNVNIE